MIDPAKADTVITAADLAAHGDGEGPEPWFVVHGHVYDGTGFLKDHPGGDQSIRLVAGEDATEDFMAIHSMDAKKMLRDYHLGRLEVKSDSAAPTAAVEPEVIDLSKPYPRPEEVASDQAGQQDHQLPRREDLPLCPRWTRPGARPPVGQHVFVRVRTKDPKTARLRPYSAPTRRTAATRSVASSTSSSKSTSLPPLPLNPAMREER